MNAVRCQPLLTLTVDRFKGLMLPNCVLHITFSGLGVLNRLRLLQLVFVVTNERR